MGSYTDTKIRKEMIHMRAHIVPSEVKLCIFGEGDVNN